MDVEHTHIQWKMRSQHFSYHMTLFSSNTERILDIFQCFVFSIFVCLPLCTFWLLSSSWINMCGEEKEIPLLFARKKNSSQIPFPIPQLMVPRDWVSFPSKLLTLLSSTTTIPHSFPFFSPLLGPRLPLCLLVIHRWMQWKLIHEMHKASSYNIPRSTPLQAQCHYSTAPKRTLALNSLHSHW